MFRLATLKDVAKVLDFISKHWDSNHVYVKNPSLFRYDFVRGDTFSMGLIEIDENVEGIFGYFVYNDSDVPDIGGMLWKVTKVAQSFYPGAGLALRKFVLQSVQHRFFGAPGAGQDTRVIYKLLGRDWIALDHFVGKNAAEDWPDFVKIEGGNIVQSDHLAEVQKITSFHDICSLDDVLFSHQTPIKDKGYLAWKYFYHPFHRYSIWYTSICNVASVVVSRNQACNGAKIMRVVDYIGPVENAARSVHAIFRFSSSYENLNYVDIVCSGLDLLSFKSLGFEKVDFNNFAVSVPNYFDPPLFQSTQVFANADPGFSNVVMVRGNGDQDRPNSIDNWHI